MATPEIKRKSKKGGQKRLGIYGKLLKWIAEAPVKPGHKAVLLGLASFASSKNGNLVWPGQDKIAERAHLTRRRVNSLCGELVELGYITIEKRPKKRGYKQPNLYILNIGHHHEQLTKEVPNISHGTSGSGKLLTERMSGSSYEGNHKKVTTLENKVDSLEASNSPEASCSSDSIGGEISSREESEGENIYRWTSKDTLAARSIVWYDFFYPFVCGRKIVRECGSKRRSITEFEELMLCIKASKLASEYSDAAQTSSSARVAFYYQCGRLFFPNARKFAANHRLSNLQSKDLNRLFDELGDAACYMIGRTMAEWRFQPKKFPRANPDISIMLENIELIERSWIEVLGKVEIPNEEWAVELLVMRLHPDPLKSRTD